MSATPDITGHWDIDPDHSRLGFSTRHAMVSRVRGAFNEVSGSVDITEDLSDSTATVVIKTASVDTRNEGRDNHLRSADFFDVETYPEIRFVSSAVDEVDENSFIVTGELFIRDMSKTVSVPLELIGIESDPFGNLRAGLEGTRRIDRKDWGVTWNTKLDSGGVLVSDKITLEFELSLIKSSPEAEAADSSEDTEDDAPTEAPTSAPVESSETPGDETPAPTPGQDAPKPEPDSPTAPKADDILPPPPPVKPAEKQAEQSPEEPQPAEKNQPQSTGKPLGKLFGLR